MSRANASALPHRRRCCAESIGLRLAPRIDHPVYRTGQSARCENCSAERSFVLTYCCARFTYSGTEHMPARTIARIGSIAGTNSVAAIRLIAEAAHAEQ